MTRSSLRQFVRVLACALLLAAGSASQAQSPLDRAMAYLGREMDRFHGAFDVYSDASAAGNHFVVPAALSGSTPHDGLALDSDWTEGCHDGNSCIRASLDGGRPLGWGGHYFLNGFRRAGDPEPHANWGDVAHAGIDLRGATRIRFWARGERGGELVEFFVGGVGRNAVDGTPATDYPDSSPRHPALGTRTRLSTEWHEYSIDVTGLDLSYVLGGFGWVASTSRNPQGVTFYLDRIRYELDPGSQARRLDRARLIASYRPLPDDPFIASLLNTAFTYDNALAALAFMARDTPDGWRRARLLCDGLTLAALRDPDYSDGGLRNAYQAGDLLQPAGWSPAGHPARVRLPRVPGGGWSPSRSHASRHVGNTAWAALALLTFHERHPTPEYIRIVRRMARWLDTFADAEGSGGFRGGVLGYPSPTRGHPEDPIFVPWAATEHNVHLFVLFSRLAALTNDDYWSRRADRARRFVFETMWDSDRGCFMTGTTHLGTPNTSVLALDAQALPLLAAPGDSRVHRRALSCADRELGLLHDGYQGFDFGRRLTVADPPDGVWLEGTAVMALTLRRSGRDTRARDLLSTLRVAQCCGPNAGDGGLIAACHDGVDTALGDRYFSRQHVGATAWFVLAELGANPYSLFGERSGLSPSKAAVGIASSTSAPNPAAKY